MGKKNKNSKTQKTEKVNISSSSHDSPPKQVREKRRHKRYKVLSLTRIEGLFKLEGADDVGARLITANDVSLGGMGLFTNGKLEPSSIGILEIGSPVAFKIKCKVIWCRDTYSKSVMSDKPFTYRAGVEFMPENEYEKNQISNLIFFLTNRHKTDR